MFYDRPLKRWVPWGPPSLSADGSSYAYVDGDNTSSKVHVVDVNTQADVVLATGGPWRIVGLASDAVYLMRIDYFDSAAFGLMAAGRGLWKLPLNGGVAEQLTSDGRNWTLGAGAAWGGGETLDVAGGPNDIVRLDLNSKQSTTWFDPGMRSYVLAFDSSGVPLILSEAADEELWRVPAPGGGIKVWSGPTDGPRPYAPVALDVGAVWFSSANMTPNWSIFRYTVASGLKLMANFVDHPVTVAGPCA